MTVASIHTIWSGGPSAPGLTVMNVDADTALDFSAALAAVVDFWTAVKGYLSNDYSLQVDPNVDLFNEADGGISGAFTENPAPAPVLGAGAGGYANGIGGRIDWATSGIVGRRRVKGRTFLVPLTSGVFNDTGLISPTVQTTFGNAATALINALETAGTPLVVWSRPGKGLADGAKNQVIAATVPTKPAVLRGRRD